MDVSDTWSDEDCHELMERVGAVWEELAAEDEEGEA
jgi:hypothetical protein